MTRPAVTVVMAAYNAGMYLKPAIDSVLHQTLPDFELIVVDDCSTDDTRQVLDACDDSRLHILSTEARSGPATARNLALEAARGKYVAVVDADDQSLPTRLASQASFLDDHVDVAVVCGACTLIDERGRAIGSWSPLRSDVALRWRLILSNPFVHSAVMYRRAVALDVGNYSARLVQAEDFGLWARMSERGALAGLSIPSALYRAHPGGISRRWGDELREGTLDVVARNVQRLVGARPPDEVLGFLTGIVDTSEPEVAREGYRLYGLCLDAYADQRELQAPEFDRLVPVIIEDLLRLARRCERERFSSAKVAIAALRRSSPARRVAPDVLLFAAKVATPTVLRPSGITWSGLRKGELSIAQVGPYPPPYGGVSVHIKRLHDRLPSRDIRSVVYCNAGSGGPRETGVRPSRRLWAKEQNLLRTILSTRETIVHCHEGWAWSPALLAALARRQKVVMTFHNQEVVSAYRGGSRHVRAAARLLFASAAVRWIAVSDAVRAGLIEVGVPASRISVVPAYLRPEGTQTASNVLPEGVHEFAKTHSPLLVTYGCRLWLDAEGGDVYGFDLCILALASLRHEHPGAGLVICIPQGGDACDLADLQRQMDEVGVADDCLVLQQGLENPAPLWSLADVFVRATRTDGDAVSVREALSLGVPVVGSDASPRPAGVTIISSGDSGALDAAIRGCLETDADRAEADESAGSDDYFAAVVAVYRDLFTSKRSMVAPTSSARARGWRFP